MRWSQDPEWHVVLQVPRKVYIQDESSLIPEEKIITDADVGPANSEPIIADEYIFIDPDDDVMVHSSSDLKVHSRSGTSKTEHNPDGSESSLFTNPQSLV
ncbi:hypothetical protein QJS04_geneDACA010942 [Acorus gramineus]|uniref:Uncharacterized protein n=1 Tax=Acorus gramineus TaxID=55184 RepID=A0AAV9BIX6_ACOGR|nr:hypothetical protein QJS04_geneDACA010942 [Acorus gramineus]